MSDNQEIFDVIDNYYKETHANPRQPGDIDSRQMVAIYAEKGSEISEKQAINIMRKMGKESPDVEVVSVWDESIKRNRPVLRKVVK